MINRKEQVIDMASKKETLKTWVVKVKGNHDFCGEGAGGAQFAHGQAMITSERLKNWYDEHEGYTVEEVKPEAE